LFRYGSAFFVADSAETTGVKWAAPAGGGALTFITESNFSNVASVTVSNCFTSTYDTYFIDFIDCYAATNTDDPHLIPRDASGDLTGLYGSYYTSLYNTGAYSGNYSSNAAFLQMGIDCGSSGNVSNGFVWALGMNKNVLASFQGTWQNGNTISAYNWSGMQGISAKTITGFKFKSSSSNVTGKIRVYGVAKS
jgi:hypothetical protein